MSMVAGGNFADHNLLAGVIRSYAPAASQQAFEALDWSIIDDIVNRGGIDTLWQYIGWQPTRTQLSDPSIYGNAANFLPSGAPQRLTAVTSLANSLGLPPGFPGAAPPPLFPTGGTAPIGTLGGIAGTLGTTILTTLANKYLPGLPGGGGGAAPKGPAPKAPLFGGPCPPGRVLRRISFGRDKCVRASHMNVFNPRALARADRRVTGFARRSKAILQDMGFHVSPRKKSLGKKKKHR